MESLYQLLYLFLYTYLGFFTHIAYSIIFFYQKRLITIKAILFFFGIAYLWIDISNSFSIKFNFIYFIVYSLGYLLSFKLFDNYLNNLNMIYKKYIKTILGRLFYYLKLIAIPPVFYHLKCYIYTKIYYHKHPWLKPLSIRRLF